MAQDQAIRRPRNAWALHDYSPYCDTSSMLLILNALRLRIEGENIGESSRRGRSGADTGGSPASYERKKAAVSRYKADFCNRPDAYPTCDAFLLFTTYGLGSRISEILFTETS
jgi:hypothetical protein